MKNLQKIVIILLIGFTISCTPSYQGTWEVHDTSSTMANVALALANDKTLYIDQSNKVFINSKWIDNALDLALELVAYQVKNDIQADNSLSDKAKKRSLKNIGSAEKTFFIKGDCLYAGIKNSDDKVTEQYCIARIISSAQERLELEIETESSTYSITLKKLMR